jgi:hypothetical protein
VRNVLGLDWPDYNPARCIYKEKRDPFGAWILVLDVQNPVGNPIGGSAIILAAAD